MKNKCVKYILVINWKESNLFHKTPLIMVLLDEYSQEYDKKQ